MVPWHWCFVVPWVRGAQLAPRELCFENMDRLAWSCCNTHYGPTGRNTCWDNDFTFETCCGDFYQFDLKHCCGSSSKCLDFAFECRAGGPPCDIRVLRLRAMRQHLRRFGPNATTCDDGSELFPPRYIVLKEKTGDMEHGRTLFRASGSNPIANGYSAMTSSTAQLKRFNDVVDRCLGEFLWQESVFGTCVQNHLAKSGRRWHSLPSALDQRNVFALSQPWRDLGRCAAQCRPKQCKIYAAEVALQLEQDAEDLVRNRLILAVPDACSNAEVAFRVLPTVISQRSPSVYQLSEVQLYQWMPGDPCEHRGRPDRQRFFGISLVMMVLPRLCQWLLRPATNGQGSQHPGGSKGSVDSLDLVNVLRVLALWHTCCLHWEIPFPFKTFCWWLRNWRGDVHDNLVEIRMQSSLEGLYVIIAVFLVLQCGNWQMFCQRLMRKVGRQVGVMYLVISGWPLLCHTSSPMNCLREPQFDKLDRSAADLFLIGMGWNWAIQMEMHIFLALGCLGLLRALLPRVLPMTCVVYWAYLLSLSRGYECNAVARDLLREVTHFSFWLHWFPTSLVLLNLDTLLRTPLAKVLMGRLKELLGHFCGPVMVAMAFLSFLLSTMPRLDAYWGLSACPATVEEASPSISYVLAGLPFHMTIFFSMHLAAAPCKRSTEGPLLAALGTFCNAFRDVNLAFNLWHQEVYNAGHAHFPAWISLQRQAQDSGHTAVEAQILFFAPLVLGTFTLAWTTYHCIEKPWALLLRKASKNCPTTLLYAASGVYLVMNYAVWYANDFSWSTPT